MSQKIIRGPLACIDIEIRSAADMWGVAAARAGVLDRPIASVRRGVRRLSPANTKAKSQAAAKKARKITKRRSST